MAETTDLKKLLVLNGPALEASGVLSFLREHFEVRTAEELDGALEAMRSSHFDAVLAETADFLPLERGVVTQQAAGVLDTIGDGVCLVGPGGELVWANRRLRDFPKGILDPLRKACAGAYEEFAAAGRTETERGRRFSLMPESGRYYEVICSPVRDAGGVLRQVAAVVVDATSQRRQQLKLNAIDRAGHELVNLEHEAVAHRTAAERQRLLVDRIIRYTRDVLDYQHFAVLLLEPSTNRLQLIVSEGLGPESERHELFSGTQGNGICGYVAATGHSYICADVRKDSRYLPGLSNARSSLTVPLRLHDKVIGVLNVESDVVNAFAEEDRQFAEIFANHIALALNILELLVVERRATHTQVSGSIAAELAGPISDIITELNEVMEDYIGHDELRRRLQGVIDRACDARRCLQSCGDAPRTGMLVSAGGPDKADPVLAGKRVLVADDEALIRQTIRDVLTRAGAVVVAVENGAAARERLGEERFDLVISDIKMPGATGYEVFAAAKDAHPDTRVILITAFGYDPGHSIVRANQEGLAAVLMKPFKVNTLLNECRLALSGRAK